MVEMIKPKKLMSINGMKCAREFLDDVKLIVTKFPETWPKKNKWHWHVHLLSVYMTIASGIASTKEEALRKARRAFWEHLRGIYAKAYAASGRRKWQQPRKKTRTLI